ncbi:hypothetical protein P3W45_001513 [Vairimorpha bombi]|jgi:hypothetical protein
MNILYLLFSTLLDYKPEKSSRLIENTKEDPHIVSLYTVDDINIPAIKNLSREILYEGFIAIDSVIFLVETNIIREKDLEKFVKETVLSAKKLLLLRPDIRKYFDNFSTNIDINNKYIKKLLQMRNKVFELDKSQIAMSITRDQIRQLENRINSELVLIEDNKENAYIRMIKALSDSRYGEDGLNVNLSKERFEFYRENVTLSKEQIIESKISLNLGGSIFGPSLLLNLIKRLTIQNKREIVKRSVSSFLEPLKILHENSINRSFMDKKKQIIEFLINCLEIRNGTYRQKVDEAFYNRSILIEHFIQENGAEDDLFKTLDELQEEEIKKLIYIFENMTEEQMGSVIIHDRRLEEKYLNYLCDGQDSSKVKLFDLFRSISR